MESDHLAYTTRRATVNCDTSVTVSLPFNVQGYVRNKARLAGQPGSEPRSPASWPKVGLKPLAVADPPPSAKPCCSPAFNYKKGPLSARSRKLAMAAPHIASLRLRGRPGLLLCLAAFGARPSASTLNVRVQALPARGSSTLGKGDN